MNQEYTDTELLDMAEDQVAMSDDLSFGITVTQPQPDDERFATKSHFYTANFMRHDVKNGWSRLIASGRGNTREEAIIEALVELGVIE